MATIEEFENGKAQLNIYTSVGWIRHIFSDIETLKKYYYKAAIDMRPNVI